MPADSAQRGVGCSVACPSECCGRRYALFLVANSAAYPAACSAACSAACLEVCSVACADACPVACVAPCPVASSASHFGTYFAPLPAAYSLAYAAAWHAACRSQQDVVCDGGAAPSPFAAGTRRRCLHWSPCLSEQNHGTRRRGGSRRAAPPGLAPESCLAPRASARPSALGVKGPSLYTVWDAGTRDSPWLGRQIETQSLATSCRRKTAYEHSDSAKNLSSLDHAHQMSPRMKYSERTAHTCRRERIPIRP
mmetsp:Transcript_6329/g.13806  ORF Transcript_6329/g.13806 Transcript_6329/m.13806 type:complete len:252 (+) Transcript_6329:1151-1906(+)